jgi:hypothetical protein
MCGIGTPILTHPDLEMDETGHVPPVAEPQNYHPSDDGMNVWPWAWAHQIAHHVLVVNHPFFPGGRGMINCAPYPSEKAPGHVEMLKLWLQNFRAHLPVLSTFSGLSISSAPFLDTANICADDVGHLQYYPVFSQLRTSSFLVAIL